MDETLRSVWFLNLSKAGDAFDIGTRKNKITIDRPFQVGIVVYQLVKLCVLEFDYDFLDKFLDQKGFELLQMDTDSLYFGLSAKKLEDVIRPKLQEGFEACKQNWLEGQEEGTRGIFILWRMRKQSKPSPLKRGFETTKAAKLGKVRGCPGRG